MATVGGGGNSGGDGGRGGGNSGGGTWEGRGSLAAPGRYGLNCL